MSDTEEKKTILALEEETATGTAKGAANLVWLRLNAFIKAASVVEDKYKMGKAIFEADVDEWAQDMGNCRHSLEMLFQEFNRAQYYKNVAKAASEKQEKEIEKEEGKGEEEEAAEDSHMEDSEKEE